MWRHTNQFNDALAQFEFEQIGFSVPRLGGGNINRNRFSFTDQTGKESRRRQRGLALIALTVAVCEAVSDLDFLLSRHYCPSSFPFVMRRRLLKWSWSAVHLDAARAEAAEARSSAPHSGGCCFGALARFSTLCCRISCDNFLLAAAAAAALWQVAAQACCMPHAAQKLA